jgi:hypothetical protein
VETARVAVPAQNGIWGQRITSFLALVLVTWALMEFCWTTLGIADNVCVVVLALACVSDPLLQLIGARRCERAPRARRGTYLTAVAAAAPWVVLGWLHELYPSSMIFQSPAVPSAVRYTGCALAFGVILLRPFVQRDSQGTDELYVPAMNVPSQLLMVSLLFVSFSITTAALTLYWLAGAAVQRLASQPHGFTATLHTDSVGLPHALQAEPFVNA